MRTFFFCTMVLTLGAGTAKAGLLANENFETGDLSGWTVGLTSRGATLVQDVIDYDIDGGGGLPTSKAARFQVGQFFDSGYQVGVFHGVELTQQLNLVAGVTYTLDADVSTLAAANANNSQGGRFELIADGNVLDTWNKALILQGTSDFSHLNGTFTPAVSGTFEVGLRISRANTVSGTSPVTQFVDNVIVTPEPASAAFLLLSAACVAIRRRRTPK